MKKSAYIIAVIFGFLVILLFSCGKDKKGPTGPTPTSDDETIISDNTTVVEKEKNLTLDSVSENTITYSFIGKSPGISKGDILVSNEDGGYLRKVTGITIEGDKVTVNTENAVLTDAFEQVKVDTTITLDFKSARLRKEIGILKSAKGVSITEDGINLSGVVLYSGNVGNNSLKVTITDGIINFNPDPDIGYEIKRSTVKEFHAIFQGDIYLDFNLEVISDGPINFNDEINVISFIIPASQFLIKLDFDAGFVIVGKAEGNLETGFDHTTQVRVGAQFESGEWKSIWEKKPELNEHDTKWPGSADLEVKGYVRPSISVKIYSIAGPYVDVEPYLGFDGKVGGEYAWFWELSGGIESYLGFDVSVLGYGIFDYSMKLPVWETVIANDFSEFPKNLPPGIPSAPSGYSSGKINTSYTFTASTTDPDGDNVAYMFDWGDGDYSTWTSFVSSGSSGSKSHSYSHTGTYSIKVKAKDSYGNESGWSSGKSITIGSTNSAPRTPSAPSGTSSGKKNTSYTFMASTTDPDGDNVAYMFDWGDGDYSTWTSFVSSGSSGSKSHSYSSTGTYTVKVKAKDSYGNESGWSSGHSITISGVTNSKPKTPGAPSGPSSGDINTSYTFTASTTDPDGDNVAYMFDWGDGSSLTWTSFVSSGSSGSKSHSYSGDGTYSIKVKAKDSYGNESGWSIGHSITIREKSKSSDITFVSIHGGTFQMGSENGSYYEKPVHNVQLDSFEMSKYEITNSQYCTYLNEVLESGDISVSSIHAVGASGEYNGQYYIYFIGGESHDPENSCWINYSDGKFTVSSGKENWPVVYVTWYGAKAFSLYYGFDLPTEAEWEYAARGGKQYEYGTDNGEKGISKMNYNGAIGHPVDVGNYSYNPYGLCDMSGNVWEWCNDWGDEDYYKNSPEHNPTGSLTGFYRIVRGGCYGNNFMLCTTYKRKSFIPDFEGEGLGFRVVHRDYIPQPNQSPRTPSTPSGPSSGKINTSYTFTASTTDPDGDNVAYMFDLGDGDYSTWTSYVSSGSSAGKSHSYSDTGTYIVKAKAKDINWNESGWSSGKSITIISTNNAPITPSAPSGPSSGKINKSYNFTASTTDPDGDKVAYKFDWGDGDYSTWTSYVSSGSSVTELYSYANTGTYTVKVKAKDSYGNESGWSSGSQININENGDDLDSYVFVTKWGSRGTTNGKFSYPYNIAIDVYGNVYVTDGGNNRIQKFTNDGIFITKWGSEGNGDGEFNSPWGIALDANSNVYVADDMNNRIQKFTSDGKFITKWGSEGSDDGQFDQLSDVAVDAVGNVYVADLGNERIQKFTSDGVFITKWGSYGKGDGEFNDPISLAVDSEGNVYVGDWNHRIQKFTSDGKFITKWGSEGSSDGLFNVPYGVAIDFYHYVYVSDNHRIQKFTSNGKFITTWGSKGEGNGLFNMPMGVTVDVHGNVYVVDLGNNRIQKFAPVF